MKNMLNEWVVSGKIFYLKQLSGEFAASVKIRGSSKRDGEFDEDIMELGCLMQKKVYDEAVKKGLTKYCWAVLSGHMESWIKTTEKGQIQKIMFIVDSVEDVKRGVRGNG